MNKEKEELHRKFRDAEMEAGRNVDPKKIMSNQEVHEFGIDIIAKYAKKTGYEIISGSTNINQHPQLILKKDGQVFFVMIKTGAGDGTHLSYDQNLAFQVFDNAKHHNAKVLFAGVGLYCVGFGFTLVRNGMFMVDFRGFEPVELLSIKREELSSFNQYRRIKYNLDESQKPKSEVVERVKRWLSDNENSIVVRKLRNKDVINITDLNEKIDYQTVTDLMTLFPDQISDEK
jgi:hypothetical protein